MQPHRRNGGDLVVETLQALGARSVFGIPGQHALGLFDALSRSELEFASSRVENNAAFAADGYSRATGAVGVLFLSTGPGALTSLGALQEAYATGVPIVVVSSQIPLSGLGARRKGMIHELDDQKASARNVTKSQATVHHTSQIPVAVQDAWAEALTTPQGPVWVEIPQDVLLSQTHVPRVGDVLARPRNHEPSQELITEAVTWLTESPRTVIVAGGGVRRSGVHAEAALQRAAEMLQAPVVCTPGGNTAFPRNHPLSLGSWVEDRHISEVLEEASVLLTIGSTLGEVTSNYFTLAPQGRIIQIDAEPRVLESNFPGLGIRADAGQALESLIGDLEKSFSDDFQHPDWYGSSPAQIVAETNERVQSRLDKQDLLQERRFMAELREAVPDDMQTFWDMTIAAYWAWNCWDARAGAFHSAQGAGGLGYGFPAAFGAAIGLADTARYDSDVPQDERRDPARVLAVAGDGSAMYSLAELAAARQHNAAVTWLIVDDGGYGILREYMDATFGQATATELSRPDFVALAESFGVDAEEVDAEDVGPALQRAFTGQGPNVVVVKTLLRMWEPSHL